MEKKEMVLTNCLMWAIKIGLIAMCIGLLFGYWT